jgi:hypothetical protein
VTITTKPEDNDATTVDFAAYEFARMNKGLVRLLKYVNEAGAMGISTRKACHDVFNSRTYGMKVIQRAEKLGYILREEEPPIERGAWFVINRITPKGKKLLSQMDTITTTTNARTNKTE